MGVILGVADSTITIFSQYNNIYLSLCNTTLHVSALYVAIIRCV